MILSIGSNVWLNESIITNLPFLYHLIFTLVKIKKFVFVIKKNHIYREYAYTQNVYAFICNTAIVVGAFSLLKEIRSACAEFESFDRMRSEKDTAQTLHISLIL